MTQQPTYPLAYTWFLSKESGLDDTACVSALNAAQGNLMAALSSLMPGRTFSLYHDVYHLGPYRRVEYPDRDLPKRASDWLPDDSYLTVKNMNGQRCIPPFRDSNELGDILGTLYVASRYPDNEDWWRFEGPTIQGYLLEAADRIADKIKRNRNPDRGAHFSAAHAAVFTASDMYFTQRYEEGHDLIWKAVHALQDGNRLRKGSG